MFGQSVGCAGDVNGDGYSDVIIGAPEFNTAPYGYIGKAFVFHGSSTGPGASANWTAISEAATSRLGASVAGAGDTNGDGYSDIVVGADYHTIAFVSQSGAAFVWHGSSTGLGSNGTPGNADKTLNSAQANSLYGTSVASAGDVNGDGYGDVIVGAPSYDGGSTDEGRAFVYHGSSTGISTSASWTAEANVASAEMGYSVACAGDVNGDGYGDVIIGAQTYANGSSSEGGAFVYHGSSSGLGSNGTPGNADWVYESNEASANMGRSVASAGDVNGDGISDVVVGASGRDGLSGDEGEASVFFGSTSGLQDSAHWNYEAGVASAQLGMTVASAGDVNGDGYSDIIIGAPEYNAGHANEGRCFVFHGSVTGPGVSANWTATGEVGGERFGTSVSAGDLNGDGYSDVIIGAPQRNDGIESGEGFVFVWAGSGSGVNGGTAGNAGTVSPNYSWKAEGNAAGARLGSSVACAGDVNGDGYSDIIAGAPDAVTQKGNAYVWHGSSDFHSTRADGTPANANWKITTTNADKVGTSVAGAGDVNGDGYSDVLVGAPGFDNGGTDRGGAFLVLGSSTGLGSTVDISASPAQYDWSYAGLTGNSLGYGTSVAGAGDVNGDGYSEMIIGAPAWNDGESGEGAAFLFYGASSFGSPLNFYIFEGDAAGAAFGTAVATAGDVNGDGYSDIIVGAPGYTHNSNANAGYAAVFHGDDTGAATTPALTTYGSAASQELGRAVASAGDVNGDSFCDVVVGAPGYSNGQSGEGQAKLFLGGGGGGAAILPRQFRSGGTTPILAGLRAGSTSEFEPGMTARAFTGGAAVKFQFEVKAFGTAFNGSSLVESSNWIDNGDSDSVLIDGLTSNTFYKWRARFKYDLSEGAVQPFSRWLYLPDNAPVETDFQTKTY